MLGSKARFSASDLLKTSGIDQIALDYWFGTQVPLGSAIVYASSNDRYSYASAIATSSNISATASPLGVSAASGTTASNAYAVTAVDYLVDIDGLGLSLQDRVSSIVDDYGNVVDTVVVAPVVIDLEALGSITPERTSTVIDDIQSAVVTVVVAPIVATASGVSRTRGIGTAIVFAATAAVSGSLDRYSATGSVIAGSISNIDIVGVSSTRSIGSVTTSIDISILVVGSEAYSSVSSSDVQNAVLQTGYEVVSSTGTVTYSIDTGIQAVGSESISSTGTVSPDLTISGQDGLVTSSIGSVLVSVDYSVQIAGSNRSSTSGLIVPNVDIQQQSLNVLSEIGTSTNTASSVITPLGSERTTSAAYDSILTGQIISSIGVQRSSYLSSTVQFATSVYSAVGVESITDSSASASADAVNYPLGIASTKSIGSTVAISDKVVSVQDGNVSSSIGSQIVSADYSNTVVGLGTTSDIGSATIDILNIVQITGSEAVSDIGVIVVDNALFAVATSSEVVSSVGIVQAITRTDADISVASLEVNKRVGYGNAYDSDTYTVDQETGTCTGTRIFIDSMNLQSSVGFVKGAFSIPSGVEAVSDVGSVTMTFPAKIVATSPVARSTGVGYADFNGGFLKNYTSTLTATTSVGFCTFDIFKDEFLNVNLDQRLSDVGFVNIPSNNVVYSASGVQALSYVDAELHDILAEKISFDTVARPYSAYLTSSVGIITSNAPFVIPLTDINRYNDEVDYGKITANTSVDAALGLKTGMKVSFRSSQIKFG